jgi:hypothetical protein
MLAGGGSVGSAASCGKACSGSGGRGFNARFAGGGAASITWTGKKARVVLLVVLLVSTCGNLCPQGPVYVGAAGKKSSAQLAQLDSRKPIPSGAPIRTRAQPIRQRDSGPHNLQQDARARLSTVHGAGIAPSSCASTSHTLQPSQTSPTEENAMKT